MPSFTTLFEDISPTLVYSTSGWRAGTSADDGSANKYTQSSFTVTNVSGSKMSFKFYGSSVSVFGARRGNHGEYTGSIDDLGPSSPQNGFSNPDLFNQLLYDANLSPGNHKLTITNNQDSFFDVDYVTVQSNIGLDNEDLIVNMFQASHPAFTYTPPSSWKSPGSMIGTFVGGSGRATTDPLALANFTFQIDNGDPLLFSANKQFYYPKQILFFAGNLGGGQHFLQIQPLASGSATGEEFAIDFATVYTTQSLGGSFLGAVDSPTEPTATPTGSTAIHASRSIPIGVIIALALAIAVAISTSLFSVYLVWRQRRFMRSSSADMSHNPPPLNVHHDPEAIRPFVLSNPPRPFDVSARRTMAQKSDVSSPSLSRNNNALTITHQSQSSASSSGMLYPGTSASVLGSGERPSASENTLVILGNSAQVVRGTMGISDLMRSPAPPPEYSQSSNNHRPSHLFE